MSFSGLILTNAGRNELIKAEMGTPFRITDIVFGDGSYNGAYTAIKSLSHKVMEMPVTKIERKGDEVWVECDFVSTDVPQAFYMREIGIIANGKLCYYDNAREEAEYIDPDAGNLIKQKRMRFVLLISGDIEIHAEIASSLYALETDLRAHESTQASADASGHVQLSDAADVTDSTGLALPASEKNAALPGTLAHQVAVLQEEQEDALAEHTGNKSNPHAVTKAQIGLGNVNNTSDANKPVSTAQQEALDGKVSKTGDRMTGMLDVAMSNGDVQIFGDSRGGHVWLEDKTHHYQLQIVAENSSAMLYLVDVPPGKTPTCLDWLQLNHNALEAMRNISVGNGAENGRISFHSPGNLRDVWLGMANDNGNFYLWDVTANKAIISAPKGGTPTFNGHASSDLALTGGNMTGNLAMGNTSMSDGPEIHWIDKFRQVWAGMCNGAGDWYLYDTTNQKSIIHSTKAGVATFYGNAASATKATQDGNGNNIVNTYQTKTGDAKDNTVTFTSADVADGSTTAWTSVAKLTTGEKLSSLFNKMSTMFKNLRYLYKLLGTTNISAIGGGTVTGAISKLNTDLGTYKKYRELGYIYKNSNAVYLVAGSDQKIFLNEKINGWNNDGYLELSNGGIKCLKSGIIKINASIGFINLSNATVLSAAIYKGTQYMINTFTGSQYNSCPCIYNHPVQVNAGDIIYLYGYCSASTGVEGSNKTRLEVEYVQY